MALPDTWTETALVAIAAASGADMAFQAITETVDIDIGDTDFHVIATLAGGRLIKFTPQEPTTITLEAYPVYAGTDTGVTGEGFFGMMNTEDNTAPLDIDVDRVRTKHRIAICWTDSGATTANAQIPSANYGLRIVAADGYFTSVKPSFTDGVLKFTVTYKVPPFDSSGTANIAIQSQDASSTLTALASYTTSTKW